MGIRVVVTGASGNLGSRLVPRLLDHPDVDSVTGVCRRPPAAAADRLDWVALDLLSPHVTDRLAEVVRGADVVIHLAWRIQPSHDLEAMRRVNVEGTRAVADAIRRTGVGALVHASSVGAYGASSKDVARDESWPATGVPTSSYSRHKAVAETILDEAEAAEPDLRVVRMRPGLVFQEHAGAEIGRYFLGPLVPLGLLKPGRLPVVPDMPGLRFQVVHADDVARAFVLAATTDVRGAFNLAAEPFIDAHFLARVLRARVVPVPARLVRAAMTASWYARLLPTDAGWLDMGLSVPVMDTSRARTELGWVPARDAESTLLEMLAGLSARTDGPTPVLGSWSRSRQLRDAVVQLASGGIGR